VNSVDAWLEDGEVLPVAFAQVREDPRLDLEVVERIGSGARILMVASGGETVAALAAFAREARVWAVDPNPAQLALGRLKLRLGAYVFDRLYRDLLVAAERGRAFTGT
jgi:S-adenosylmethionine-diacylglycerol 3-amino-3-carboxypropyl transferase